MTVAIPAYGEIIILSMEYAPDGLSWARLYDNHSLGWLVTEAVPVITRDIPIIHSADGKIIDPLAPGGGQGPPETTGEHQPFPLILGSLAMPAVDTAPVISPQWGKYADPVVFIPDLLRLPLDDFLFWLATNNGAHRPIGSMLGLSRSLLNGYNEWAARNPELSFKGNPPPQLDNTLPTPPAA